MSPQHGARDETEQWQQSILTKLRLVVGRQELSLAGSFPPKWSGDERQPDVAVELTTIQRNAPDVVTFSFVEVHSDERLTLWDLEFAAGGANKVGGNLVVGHYYPAADGECLYSAPASCAPELHITRDRSNLVPHFGGRATGPRGSFEVLESAYGVDGAVLAFAADFTQYDPSGNVFLWGKIRHNSSLPIPEPASIAASVIGFCLLTGVRNRHAHCAQITRYRTPPWRRAVSLSDRCA
jgi:hypothetical protein